MNPIQEDEEITLNSCGSTNTFSHISNENGEFYCSLPQ